ncbi:radical SAM superfamily enzyme YgiQ (UPF0313 family) [Desulfobaculum xiamenense]|uniref:Radical SAM superfamily enzyme YgiQ (UPF0313 family) n=1 Tax=Desulfobaculum xiamenense TaxID=995050 RepID=A0A846QRF2_9BACT|nr:radical SAM protein [Desulfobaculum xiamenense]NJB67774.1 radical SAM superfamily enzyme YgiQ (UPF0313 family) [Desulfobaculum xiamenense]
MSATTNYPPESGVYYGLARPSAQEWGGRLPIALVFPGPARLGLSTLGWQVVWKLLNEHPALIVERFFWEGGDEEPRAYDSNRPLSSFPVIAFSLNFEEEYRDMVEVLDRAGIAVRSSERGGWPLVLAGGPLAFLNPAPVAPAVDLFWAGEAEVGFANLAAEAAQYAFEGRDLREYLEAVAQRDGIYVPGLSKLPVRRVLAGTERDLPNPGHSCFVTQESEFRDMFLLEVNRGCPYGCRFCAAGFIYRPPRHARVEVLRDIVERVNPGKVGLVGTALTDWPDLFPFLQWLNERGTKFSLASLRYDGLTEEFLTFLRRTGTRSVTLALEGASHRIRKAINKRLDETKFLEAVERISRLQFNHLKLYIIAGWPDETEDDYRELGQFLHEINAAIEAGRGGKKAGVGHVTLGVSSLVPKPWTPFQWAPMASEAHLDQAMKWLKKAVKPVKGVQVRVDKPGPSRLQGLLARGDEKVFDLIELAALEGKGWKHALREWDGDPADYLDRERGADEKFPWECIDTGVDRDFLRKEWERYKNVQASPLCGRVDCTRCNACGMGTWLYGEGEEGR